MRSVTLLLLLVTQTLFGFEVDYALKVRSENSLYTKNGNLQKALGYAKIESTLYFDDDSKVYASGIAQGDIKDHIYPQKYETANYSNLSKPAVLGTVGKAELRELYYEKEFEDFSLKLGKMQSVWGKADGIKLLDVLNPQDFSEFILQPFDESRIPLWSVDLNYVASDLFQMELVWIPDTTYHKLPQNGSDYAFTTPRIIPKAPAGVGVNVQKTDKPNLSLNNSDIGTKITATYDEIEVSFYALYAYDDAPVLFQSFDASSMQVIISPKYERFKLYGLSSDYAKGDFVFRLESAYMQDKYYLNTNNQNGVQQSDSASYVFGVDWYGLEQSVVSVQLYQSILLDYNDGFARDRVDTTTTLLYKKDWLNETLHLEALGIYNLNDKDGLLKPKLSYEIDDETLLYSELDYFFGDKNGLYGEFYDANRVVIGIETTF